MTLLFQSSGKQTMNDLITYLLVCIGLLKRQLKRNNKYDIPPQYSKSSTIWNWVPTGEPAVNHWRSMLDMELSGPESRQPPREDVGTDCERFQVTPRWHLIPPSTSTRALYCIFSKYNALIGLKIVLTRFVLYDSNKKNFLVPLSQKFLRTALIGDRIWCRQKTLQCGGRWLIVWEENDRLSLLHLYK